MSSIVSRILRYSGHLSLKYKLFVLLVTMSIIPLTLVSYSSQYFMFRSSTEYSSSISSQYIGFVSQNIAVYLQDVSQSFDSLFTHSDFQKYLETPEKDLVTQANHIIGFRPTLKNALRMHNEILGVLYLDRTGKVYYDSYQKRFDYQYDLRNDPYFESLRLKTAPELSPPHPMNYVLDGKDRAFSFMRPIFNLRTGIIDAWFVIEIREDKLKSLLFADPYKQEGSLLLFHEKEGSVFSNVGINADVKQDLRASMPSLQQSSASSKWMFTSGNTRYEATSTPVPRTDWKLIWMAPLSSMTKGVEQSTRTTMMIAVLSFAISLIIAFPVMRIVLSPLSKLKRGMYSLGRGSYVPIETKYANDEIGFLIQSYNQMLKELQRMEAEVYHSQIKGKERELLQLQAQINPHFLFNTLETIESYAGKNNGEAVGDMVQSVSRMMRYNVRNDGGWAPLKEELAYIQSFLTIHYYRNRKEISTEFRIAPECYEVPIMKLSIQPFVENAIKYGWNPSGNAEDFVLTVEVTRSGELMHISVQDTGPGIPAPILEKLLQLAKSKGEIVDPFFREHTGIINVFRRFLLAYGENVDFNIIAAPKEGTRFTISLPYV